MLADKRRRNRGGKNKWVRLRIICVVLCAKLRNTKLKVSLYAPLTEPSRQSPRAQRSNTPVLLKRDSKMKPHPYAIAIAFALLLPIAAAAAMTTVSGHGQSYDPGIALQNARADATGKCTAQGGTPAEEVYSHVIRANLWLADSIWRCEVP